MTLNVANLGLFCLQSCNCTGQSNIIYIYHESLCYIFHFSKIFDGCPPRNWPGMKEFNFGSIHGKGSSTPKSTAHISSGKLINILIHKISNYNNSSLIY